jgi:MFS family permease
VIFISTRSTSGRRSRKPLVLHRPVAFWLVAATTATLTAASSAPSPLYPVYQAEFRFSAITLTVIFAVYVFALMASLLTVGRLSDYVGRRVVFAGALVVEAAAMALSSWHSQRWRCQRPCSTCQARWQPCGRRWPFRRGPNARSRVSFRQWWLPGHWAA